MSKYDAVLRLLQEAGVTVIKVSIMPRPRDRAMGWTSAIIFRGTPPRTVHPCNFTPGMAWV